MKSARANCQKNGDWVCKPARSKLGYQGENLAL